MLDAAGVIEEFDVEELDVDENTGLEVVGVLGELEVEAFVLPVAFDAGVEVAAAAALAL